MQPTYVKLKLPVKAFQLLLLIMVIGQQCKFIRAQMRCFGPVWKMRVNVGENSRYSGDIYVNTINKQISVDRSNERELFRISTSFPIKGRHRHHPKSEQPAFYLFDPEAKRFLCWKRPNGSMTTMTYNEVHRGNQWEKCKLSDRLPDDLRFRDTHVLIYLAGHLNSTMKFDRRGRTVGPKRIRKCQKKSENRKCWNDYFMVFNTNRNDCCHEAYRILCKGQMAHMAELRAACSANELCERHGGY